MWALAREAVRSVRFWREKFQMDKLKPGRELDALIAQKVLGLEVKRGSELKDFVSSGSESDFWTPIKDVAFGTKHQQWMRVMNYSTNESAAFGIIVEELDLFRAFGSEISGAQLTKNPDGNWEFYRFLGMAVNDFETIAEGDSPAHAICLAALKVKS